MAIAILDPDIVAEDRKSGDAAEMFQLRIVQDTDDHSQMQYRSRFIVSNGGDNAVLSEWTRWQVVPTIRCNGDFIY